jgi:hypothetical protein
MSGIRTRVNAWWARYLLEKQQGWKNMFPPRIELNARDTGTYSTTVPFFDFSKFNRNFVRKQNMQGKSNWEKKSRRNYSAKKNYPMKRTLYIIKIALSSKIPSYIYVIHHTSFGRTRIWIEVCTVIFRSESDWMHAKKRGTIPVSKPIHEKKVVFQWYIVADVNNTSARTREKGE